MPAHLRAQVTAGFRAFAKLSIEKQTLVAQQIIEKLNTDRETDVEDFASTSGLPIDETVPILPTATLLLALISSRSDSTDEMLSSFKEIGFLDTGTEEGAARLLDYLVSRRNDIKRSMRISEIEDELIPSFSALHTSVEVRLKFRDDKVVASVPVALAHLHTDKKGTEIYFQFTRADVRSLIRQLETLSKKLAVAERWNSERPE